MPHAATLELFGQEYSPCKTLEQIVRNMYKLGLSWQQRHDDESAEIAYRLVMEVKEANPRFNSAEYVFSASNLAGILTAQRKFLEAEHLYLKATTAALAFFGLHHRTFARTLRNYANFLRRTDLTFEAEDIDQQAHDLFAQGFDALAKNLFIDEEGNNEAASLHDQSRLNKRRSKKMRAGKS